MTAPGLTPIPHDRVRQCAAVLLAPPGIEPGLYAVGGCEPLASEGLCLAYVVATWAYEPYSAVAPGKKRAAMRYDEDPPVIVSGCEVQAPLVALVHAWWQAFGPVTWAKRSAPSWLGAGPWMACAWSGSRAVASVAPYVRLPVQPPDALRVYSVSPDGEARDVEAGLRQADVIRRHGMEEP